MMEDFDIYADLPSFHADECENDNKENTSKKFEEKNQILEKEVSLLKIKLQELEGINDKLKKNFSSLIKTAKAEISRKDRTISDLRAQLENFTFRRNPYHRNSMHHVQSNHYLHNPPPPVKIEPNSEIKLNQGVNKHTYQAQSTINEFAKEENNVNERRKNISINDNDDAINNNPEYRNTIYGERLRKKLQKEMESERRKKEEELKIKNEEQRKKEELIKKNEESRKKLEDESNKNVGDESQKLVEDESTMKKDETKKINECFDKVNNKENLAVVNEAAGKVDANINSDKTLDAVTNNTDFVKKEVILTKKIDYAESKDDQCIIRKGDIPKYNKYFVANGNVTDTLTKNHSNNHSSKRYHNDSSVQKDYRNRDDYNYHDRHRHNDVLYIDSNNRHSRKDKYYNQFEKNDRHRNSHRYKSRDRERSSSSSAKDELRKKHTKSLEDKHDHTSKKIKLGKNDKDVKYNFISKHDKVHKRDQEEHLQNLEISKKHKDYRDKTPKRKRRSESEEKLLHISKRNKLNVKACSADKISTEKVKKNSSETKDSSIQDDESKRIKGDNELSNKHIEHIKECAKLNKITEDKRDKKLSIKKYDDKVVDNVEYIKEKVQLNRNIVSEINIDNLEQKDSSTAKQDVSPDNKNEKVTSDNNSHIMDVTNVNMKPESQMEDILNELEEGEIVDSANDELLYKCVGKQSGATSQMVINIKTTSKLMKIQENDQIKETLNSCRIEANDSSETVNENGRSLEIMRNAEVHCAKSVGEPKKDENTIGENRLLLTLLTQNVQTEIIGNSQPTRKENKDVVENTIEKVKLDDGIINTKLTKDENNLEESNVTSANETKPIDNERDKTNCDIPMVNKIMANSTDNCTDDGEDCKLQIIINNEITTDEDIEIHVNEKNIENTFDSEEHKDKETIIITNDEVKNCCIERRQNNNDDIASQKDDYEGANINNRLNNVLFKSSDNLEVQCINNEEESSFQKKTLSLSKLQAVRNVIIVRRRRRPVQLSDSPPVLIITQTGVNK